MGGSQHSAVQARMADSNRSPKRQRIEDTSDIPTSSCNNVNPMLTDMYQLTMAYAYWRSGRHEEHAVFDLFFRKNPFKGEFTVFAGLDEVLRFLHHYSFTTDDIDYLRDHPTLKECDQGFFDWLRSVDMSKVKIYAMAEGTLCFPKEPLLIVEGPLGIVQLLETTLLCL